MNDMRLQELLQQMLHMKPRSPATQSIASPSSSVSSRLQPAAQTAPEPSDTAQPKSKVAAAAVPHPAISKQSSGQSTEQHSMFPLACQQSAETASRGVHTPASDRCEQAASAKEADTASAKEAGTAGYQAVSLVAKPELYSALTAAVSAIVQQAGLAKSQPAINCLKGISLQHHADGQGAQRERQSAGLEERASQPEGQPSWLERPTAGVERQQRCSEGQQAVHEGQQQDCSPPNSAALATVSSTSPDGQMAAPSSLRQACLGQISAEHSTADATQIKAQHAQHGQRYVSEADDAQVARGQQVDGQGGVADGPGQLQAWQAQIEQAMQVLQAALRSSPGHGEAPQAVLAPR